MDSKVYEYLKNNKRDVLLYCNICNISYTVDLERAVNEINSNNKICYDCILNDYYEELPCTLDSSINTFGIYKAKKTSPFINFFKNLMTKN